MRITSALALTAVAATAFLSNHAAHAESQVLELTSENFEEKVPQEKLILVNFYAPWCGHCQKLEPEYEKAAVELKESGIPLAKVDCESQSSLCKKYDVSGYPTLKLFKEGSALGYKGTRNAEDIVMYMKRHAGPATRSLKPEELDEFIASSDIVVVAVIPSEKSTTQMTEDLEAIANYYRDDFQFGLVETSPELKDGGPGVILYKTFDEGKNILEGDFTDRSLRDFVRSNAVPILADMGPKNYMHYMDAKTPLAYLFYSTAEEREKFATDLEPLAKEMRGKLNFAFVNANKFGAHADNVGLKSEWPAFSIQDVVTAEKYPLEQKTDEPVTIERIKKHVDAFLRGDFIFNIKSEPVPEGNDGPIKIVVGHSYESIVEDMDKDVLIEFYAPWCGFCQKLEPTYKEIGEMFKGTNIVIAKMDATANDIPVTAPFSVSGYPTFMFRKAGSQDYIEYSGQQSKEAIVEFLKENAVNKVDVNINDTANEVVPDEAANKVKDRADSEVRDEL
ncbi:protein disulfide-isomerase precursor [Lunasporangiospora selenospora]|uniref:Protein disulfide-isomerase n=1 Tax=Lunasporangiospora selenospora TaxID=979761 RepID=A0A9P6G4X4_9FUNG|nr:protein disulfide-isomerase precursor [Lunasporangiospora selenospora]